MRRAACSIGLLAALLATSWSAAAQEPIRWESTIENAQRAAAQSNRLVLVYFSGPWCEACKLMEAHTLSQPTVAAELAANYVPVKINPNNFPAFAKQCGVTFLPTTVVMTPTGQRIDAIVGRAEATAYLARLGRVAADARQRGGATYAQLPGPSTGPNPQSTTSPQLPPTANQPPVAALSANAPSLATTNPPALPSTMPAGPSLEPARSIAPAAQPVGSASPALGDRYADYFRRNSPPPISPVSQPSNATPSAQPPLTDPSLVQPSTPPAQPAFGPPSIVQPSNIATAPPSLSALPQPAVSPVPSMPSSPPVLAGSTPPALAAASPAIGSPSFPPSRSQPTMSAPNGPVPTLPPALPSIQPAVGNPSFGLDGYCAVSLSEKQKWVKGDRRYGAIHRGRTYLFSGVEEQRRFFADPDRYAPMASGNDLVLAVEKGASVPGMREHGIYLGNHVYLFSSEETLERFARNPGLYARGLTPPTSPPPAQQALR